MNIVGRVVLESLDKAQISRSRRRLVRGTTDPSRMKTVKPGQKLTWTDLRDPHESYNSDSEWEDEEGEWSHEITNNSITNYPD